MPDLGSLSNSGLLGLTHCPDNFKSLSVPFVSSTSLYPYSLKNPNLDGNLVSSIDEMLELSNNQENVDASSRNNKILKIRVVKTSHDSKDYLKAWRERKIAYGAPVNRCFLSFVVGAPRLVECRTCSHFIYPGDEVYCSVRGCRGVYHLLCAKDRLGCSALKKFKCPQHACFLCKQKFFWRCIRCGLASHDKCAPWPDKVVHLNDQPGWAICWRHRKDWRFEQKQAILTDDIEEIFCRLPLPYVEEEFKIDSSFRDKADQNIEEIFHCLPLPNEEEEFKVDMTLEDDTNYEVGPPPYVHIRRNVYLVKKKRDNAYVDIGCTACNSTCSEDCVCRVQCISCSKACHCSENCTNRPFRKDKKIKIVKTELCGWGVEAAESMNKGDFVVEYIGEVIDDVLCEQRLWDMKFKGMKNFYMCELRKDFTIDATFKGNASRFLNHSCDPNCKLEKWQVEGETRVGVFAAQSIKVGEPLTYDYRFVEFGPEVKCHCGAANCQGYLGTKKKIGLADLCWGSKRKRSPVSCIAVVSGALPTSCLSTGSNFNWVGLVWASALLDPESRKPPPANSPVSHENHHISPHCFLPPHSPLQTFQNSGKPFLHYDLLQFIAMQRPAKQHLAALRPDNENLKCLNTRILRDLVEKKQEVTNLLESNKSLECELMRSRSEIESLKAELTQLKTRCIGRLIRQCTAFSSRETELEEMKQEIKALRCFVAESWKLSFSSVVSSATVVFASVASYAYVSGER
ncbi:hypothetical protein Nepgr_018457 [Nepenthes gracilis]|uniref:Histone-lysine N-methyltransferase ASHR3 n=1 Tax=Nepenthes gracilis TaxID=150966 RepID=A0AAD3STQ0_NEPGR|nr:hypothetical protein Nepgr_018457 [Nepenthes gracilis]